jgi:hypothetical protein
MALFYVTQLPIQQMGAECNILLANLLHSVPAFVFDGMETRKKWRFRKRNGKILEGLCRLFASHVGLFCFFCLWPNVGNQPSHSYVRKEPEENHTLWTD